MTIPNSPLQNLFHIQFKSLIKTFLQQNHLNKERVIELAHSFH